jgi:hypothetical protein
VYAYDKGSLMLSITLDSFLNLMNPCLFRPFQRQCSRTLSNNNSGNCSKYESGCSRSSLRLFSWWYSRALRIAYWSASLLLRVPFGSQTLPFLLLLFSICHKWRNSWVRLDTRHSVLSSNKNWIYPSPASPRLLEPCVQAGNQFSLALILMTIRGVSGA